MKLTGKCKEDFEKWLLRGDYHDLIIDALNLTVANSITKSFHELPDSMKYGVYVDWFDSVGINVLMFTQDSENFYTNLLKKGRYLIRVGGFKTRPEARTAAINKANSLYNGIQ